MSCFSRLQTRSCQLELDFDGLFDHAHFDLGGSADSVLEPVLAHGRELVSHRLVLLPSQGHRGLARVEPVHAGRQFNRTICNRLRYVLAASLLTITVGRS